MKLSEYVALLNLLDTIDIGTHRTDAIRSLNDTLDSIVQYRTQLGDFSQRLQSDFSVIAAGIDQFTQTVLDLKKQLEQEIINREHEYIQNSIRVYQTEMIREPPHYILNRRLTIDATDQEYLQSRLAGLSDWKYPGLCIRPGKEDFVKTMVALDPLYLMDQTVTLLDPAVELFEEQYQRRLRLYTVNDYGSSPYLKALPDNQFAVIFAYGFFNYKPLHIITQYLKELFVKLRPGGTLIMSYNNCDRAHGVGLAEQNFMTYTPLRLLIPIVNNIGYININNRCCVGDADILELARPGELSTTRGGQTMAKILADC
jgi:SAM-dependent methyltransferase